jgi:hypothetical protein
MTIWLKLGLFIKFTKCLYTTNMRYTLLGRSGDIVKLSKKKRANSWIHRCERVGGPG